MQARLILLDPPAARREINLTLPATIGRSREARFKLVHGQVSRLHCEFFERSGLLYVRDLGSTNGTCVGDERIEEALVRPGDTVTIGAVKFQVQYEPADSAILPAPETVGADTIRKAGEATFRAPAADVPSKMAEGEAESAATAAFGTIPFDGESLLPLEETQSPATAALAVQSEADDDSLHILPPSNEAAPAAEQPPPELEWRVPEPSSPVETEFAFHAEESRDKPLEPPHQPAAQQQSDKPAPNNDDDFDEFLKSLELE